EVFVQIVFDLAVQLLSLRSDLLPVRVTLVADLNDALSALERGSDILHLRSIQHQFMSNEERAIVEIQFAALLDKLRSIDFEHLGERLIHDCARRGVPGHRVDLPDFLVRFLLVISNGSETGHQGNRQDERSSSHLKPPFETTSDATRRRLYVAISGVRERRS